MRRSAISRRMNRGDVLSRSAAASTVRSTAPVWSRRLVTRPARLPFVPAGVGCRKLEHPGQPGLAVGAVVGQRLAGPFARDQDAAPGVAKVFAAVGLALAAARDQARSGVLGLDAVAEPVRAG